MAFTNLPPNLKDMFYALSDRISKLETGPNQAMYTAESAQGTSSQALVEAAQALTEAEAALAEAQAAYALGSQALIKDANTITNAQNQLTAINTNGITVYSGASASSGSRVIMNSAGLAGYNSSGSPTFSIAASTGAVSTVGALFTQSTISGGSLNINGNTIIDSLGKLTAVQGVFTGSITAYSGAFTGTVTAASGTIGGWNLTATKIYSGTSELDSTDGSAVFGDITGFGTLTNYGNLSTTSSYGIDAGGAITAGTSITSNGLMRANGELYAAGHTTTPNAANGYVFSTGGRIARSTASSQRYKHDIVDLKDVEELDPTVLYNLPVRAFRFNDGYITATDDRVGVLVPGFIAEEVDAIYPAAADYADGQVETWNDRMLIPGLLYLIQEQNKRITELENKLLNP